ncbi:MAG: hypothetical protein AAFP69_18260 [Planctomycetota bacterium]
METDSAPTLHHQTLPQQSDVTRRVWLDLLTSPLSLAPVVLGGTALMFSWAFGSDPILLAGSVLTMLAGVGIGATRAVLGMEGISERAYEELRQEAIAQRNQQLDQLSLRLFGDQDPRTESLLRGLRQTQHAFDSLPEKVKNSAANFTVFNQVYQVIDAAIAQLQYTLQLHDSALRVSGEPQRKILQQREAVIREVSETTQQLDQTAQQLHVFATNHSASDLASLRGELDESLKIARATEQRMRSLENQQTSPTSDAAFAEMPPPLTTRSPE